MPFTIYHSRTVVVRDGKIVSLLQTGGAVPPSARILSGSGKFLIPGLWDMHVHLATSAEPHLAEQIMLPLFLAHGVSVCATWAGRSSACSTCGIASHAALSRGQPSSRPGPSSTGRETRIRCSEG